MTEHTTIGVLALQGAFAEHLKMLKAAADQLGASVSLVEVRTPAELSNLDGLVIPGGESTVMGVFLQKNGFLDVIKQFSHDKCVMGTCAGLILLADNIQGGRAGGSSWVGGLAVTVSRNHFGRQLNSFESDLTCTSSSIAAENRNIAKGVFIRAPAILSVDSPDVQVLATLKYKDQPIQPVAVQQGKLMGLSFHPELTDDARWHKAFLHMVLQDRQKRAAAAQS